MANVALAIKTKYVPVPFNEIRLVHTHVDSVEKMSFDEFRKAWRQQLKNNRNPALNYFNRQNDEFKFCVLTLANRNAPGSFRLDDVGKPFEYFNEARRELIIVAMNKMSRWGRLLPRQFSVADCFLSE